jgi:hypothetical protein
MPAFGSSSHLFDVGPCLACWISYWILALPTTIVIPAIAQNMANVIGDSYRGLGWFLLERQNAATPTTTSAMPTGMLATQGNAAPPTKPSKMAAGIATKSSVAIGCIRSA